MKTPVFTGIIKQGKLTLENPRRYLVHIARYEGKRVEVVVRTPKSQRSTDQNAAYWGIAIEILCDHLGFDKDAMHDALKIKFASRIDGKTGLMVTESTAKMDTKRFMQYYGDIQRWAADFLNVYIPDPNECDYSDGSVYIHR